MVPASPAGLATFSHGEIVKFFSAGVLIFQLPSLWGTLPKIHLKNPSDSYAVLLGQDAAHTPCSPPRKPWRGSRGEEVHLCGRGDPGSQRVQGQKAPRPLSGGHVQVPAGRARWGEGSHLSR